MLVSSTGHYSSGAQMPSDFKPSINEQLRADAATTRALMDAFMAIRPTMPAQYIVTFLMVAANEGLSVTDYAKDAGVSQSVMTRHLLDIGERNRRKEEGFGLVVQRPDPMDLRRHRAFLTAEGVKLMHQISRVLHNAHQHNRK